jgi:hypothetical protein
MGKKKFFLIIDTETTQDGKVADFGAVVCDRQGNVHHEIGLLVKEFYFDRVNHPLFHIFGDKNDVFSAASLPARYAKYDAMIENGTRMAASVAAINRWLAKVNAKYNPVLTAYNLAFDNDKMDKSGIIAKDLFDKQFCLWYAAADKWGKTKAYREFVLRNHFFGNRTKGGHIGYQTKADAMAKFLLGDSLPDEPHTALEDAKDYELPILTALVKNTLPKDYMNPSPYSWRDYALKNNFRAI